MNKIFLLIMTLTALQAYGKSIDLRIDNLKDSYERKIQSVIKPYVGPDKDFSVVVDLKTKIELKESVTKGFNDLDAGYLPLEVSDYTSQQNEQISIESVQVSVLFYEEINQSIRSDVTQLITTAMKGHKTDISFTQVNAIKKDTQTTEAPAPVMKPQEIEAPFVLKDFLIKHAEIVLQTLMFTFMIFAATVGLMKLISCADRMFAGLSEGLKYWSDRFFDSQKFKSETEGIEDNHYSKDSLEISPTKSVVDQDLERHYNIIRDCLISSPRVLRDVILTNKNFMIVFKMSLSKFIDLQDHIKHTLNKQLWVEMEKNNTTFNEIEFYTNLTLFSEKVSLALVKEKGALSHLVSSENHRKLETIEPHIILSALNQFKDPGVLKFAIDYLPQHESSQLVKSFDEKDWSLIFGDRVINTESLNEGVATLITKCEQIQREMDKTISEDSLGAMIEMPLKLIAKSSNFEEVENIISTLEKASPSIASILRAKIWTPQSLMRLNPTDILSAMTRFSMNDRALFLYNLDDTLASNLIDSIESEREMQIIEDTLNVLRTNKLNSDEKKKSNLILKAMIDELQSKFDKGEIKFIETETRESRLSLVS